jgi:hypothetical protein
MALDVRKLIEGKGEMLTIKFSCEFRLHVSMIEGWLEEIEGNDEELNQNANMHLANLLMAKLHNDGPDQDEAQFTVDGQPIEPEF